MSLLTHSPPYNNSTSRSEPDLKLLSEPDSQRPFMENITQRNKRPRSSEESPDDLGSFKTEMMQMMREFVTTQNSRMDKLETHILQIKSQSEKIETTNVEIEKSLTFMSDQFTSLERKIDSLDKERKDMVLQLSNLEEKIEAFERQHNKTSIEIRDVPKNHKETRECLFSTVQYLAQQLKLKLQSSDIRDVARLPSKKEHALSSLVVEFSNTLTQSKFLKASKDFNQANPEDKLSTRQLGLPEPRSSIFISELLTAKSKRLHYLARRFAKDHHYDYCWVSGGQILLRKKTNDPYIIIKQEQQLKTLLPPTPNNL